MASPREIRRRIRSVSNMSQITRAMEMVSAAKLRRAQQRVLASRPYSERLQGVIADLAALNVDPENVAAFPLLEQREVRRSAVILITPDRGLTGALNSNIIRRASRYVLSEAGVPVEVIAAGKKGLDFMVRTRQEVVAEFTGIGDQVELAEIGPIARVALADFTSGKVDAVYVVFARFVNTLTQVPEVRQILPIQRPAEVGAYTDYIFEPSPQAVLASLLPRFVEIQIYQAMLESIASEHSARMVAMRNASQNAKDLVSDLTLSLNKARQAQITREVSEIAAGANALGGKEPEVGERQPRVTADRLLRALARDGWSEKRTKGGHIVLHHPEKSGRPVVPYHRGRTITPKTFQNILHEAGLSVDELRDLP